MEEIYINVECDKTVCSRHSTVQTGPWRSKRKFQAGVVCLGLLSVALLAGLVGLAVHHHDSGCGSAAELSITNHNLTEELSLKNLSLMKADLLNTSLPTELDRIQSLSGQTERPCPAGWRMFNRSCYLLSKESGSWTRGRQDCSDREADLVVIDSAEEQTFLSNFTKAEVWAWIGLIDGENEGTWKWIEGTPLTLSYWEANQPDNGGNRSQWGEEDCAHIRTGKNTEKNWNDRSCGVSLRWICEKAA